MDATQPQYDRDRENSPTLPAAQGMFGGIKDASITVSALKVNQSTSKHHRGTVRAYPKQSWRAGSNIRAFSYFLSPSPKVNKRDSQAASTLLH